MITRFIELLAEFRNAENVEWNDNDAEHEYDCVRFIGSDGIEYSIVMDRMHVVDVYANGYIITDEIL